MSVLNGDETDGEFYETHPTHITAVIVDSSSIVVVYMIRCECDACVVATRSEGLNLGHGPLRRIHCFEIYPVAAASDMRCTCASNNGASISGGNGADAAAARAATGAVAARDTNEAAKYCIAGENPITTIGGLCESGGLGPDGERITRMMHRTFSAGISAMARSNEMRAATRERAADSTDPAAARATVREANDVAVATTGDASARVCLSMATSTRARVCIARELWLTFYHDLNKRHICSFQVQVETTGKSVNSNLRKHSGGYALNS